MTEHSLYRLVRLAQRLLPPAIALVVLAFELALSPFDHTSALFWLRLGFYGLVGPLVTYAVLEWIAQEVLEKARAERALEEANRRLLASERVFREALASENLEEAVLRIARGLEETLGYPVALEAEGVRSGEGCGGRWPCPGLRGTWRPAGTGRTRSSWRSWPTRWRGRSRRWWPGAATSSPSLRWTRP